MGEQDQIFRRRAAWSVGVVLAIGVGVVVWAWMDPTPDGVPARVQSQQSSGLGGNCGARLDVQGGAQGVALAIQEVRRGIGDVPEVKVSLTSPQKVDVDLSNRRWPFQLLILKDGHIVAGQKAAQGGSPPSASASYSLTLSTPMTATLTPGGPAPCPGSTWSSIWTEPEHYEVVALIDANELLKSGTGTPLASVPGTYVRAERPLS